MWRQCGHNRSDVNTLVVWITMVMWGHIDVYIQSASKEVIIELAYEAGNIKDKA